MAHRLTDDIILFNESSSIAEVKFSFFMPNKWNAIFQ